MNALRATYRHGRIRFAEGVAPASAAAILAFVREGRHLAMPESAKVAHSNPDTSISTCDFPGEGTCVLKEIRPPRRKGLARFITKSIQMRVWPRSFRALHVGEALRKAGVRAIEPIAAWTDHRGGFRNFLLYRRVEGVALGDHWMGGMPFLAPEPPPPPPALIAYGALAGILVRDLFEAGFAHVDLHPKNVVVPKAMDGSGPMSLLDLDAVIRVPSRFWGRRVRFTAMAKSLRHVAESLPEDSDPVLAAFLHALCRNDAAAEHALRPALDLWRRGGGRNRFSTTISSFLRCPPPPRPDGTPHPWDRPPRRLPSYDLAFSLGYDCNTSLALRHAGLQFHSFPFDWLKRAPLQSRVDLLARRFSGWLDPNGLVDSGAAATNRFAKRHHVVTDTATGLELRHDFPLELPIATVLPEVAAKYARRIDRLLSEIEAADRVVAVFCSGFHFPELTMEQLVAAHDSLCAAFGGKIDVIGVTDDMPGQENHATRIERAAGGHVLRVSAPCASISATLQEFAVNDHKLAAVLQNLFVVPDPRSAAEKDAYRELSRRHAREKYAAKSWMGLIRNMILFRCYRTLHKKLLRLGLLPPDSPGNPLRP